MHKDATEKVLDIETTIGSDRLCCYLLNLTHQSRCMYLPMCYGGCQLGKLTMEDSQGCPKKRF